MICELFNSCNFFKTAMAEMPKSAEYIKNKLCFSDYNSCSRYHVFRHNMLAGNSTVDLLQNNSGDLMLVIPDKIKSDINCQDFIEIAYC